ncbi:MAG: MoxR family ATPase [Bryobacterales bacterium]|nr:MoxR family ATPase [Bryobacterales bacterium]
MSQRETLAGSALSIARLQQWEELLGQSLRGKHEVIRLSLACLLARGHLLIEDVPGVGKTTLAQALARSVRCDFHRLQFTSDMLPGDVLGVTVYNVRTETFEFKRGPIFTNFLLADEINRTTPKTQSALLEAMNEGQVSVDGATYRLVEPFMVIATQNPVEHHGTYPLPESQLDRFLLRLRIGYPDVDSERLILRGGEGPSHSPEPVMDAAELLALREEAETVRVDDAVLDYLLAIVEKTRNYDLLSLGVSPRGAQAMYRAVQALAFLEGRAYAVPEDVKRLAVPVLAHRVLLNTRVSLTQRSADSSEKIIKEILNQVPVPV